MELLQFKKNCVLAQYIFQKRENEVFITTIYFMLQL